MVAPEIQPRSVGVHRLAIVTTLAMFPLIWFGGLTTSHQAGMSVPDWPNTYGYNMFAVPWDIWLGEDAGGIFFEHTHRLLGSLVGMLAIVTCIWAWRSEPRRWVSWTATALLLAIIVQGVLGGLRVVLVELDLAIVHGIFAQVTLCLAGFLCLATSRWWQVAPAASRWSGERMKTGASRQRLATAATGTLTLLIFAQLVIAAVMRHYEAGLAVPDFPLSYGQLAPPVSGEGLARANEVRAFDYHLEPVSLGQIWLHTAHRIGAVLVTLGVVWVVWEMFHVEHSRRLRRHGLFLAFLLIVQVCLGVATVWMAKPADIATAHVAVGALLLLTSWLLTVRVARQYGWQPIGSAEPPRTTGAALPAPVSAPESAPAADLRVPVSV